MNHSFKFSGYYFPFNNWHRDACWFLGGNVLGGNWWDINKHGQFVDSFCILGFCFERRRYSVLSGALTYKINVVPFDRFSVMLELEIFVGGRKFCAVSNFIPIERIVNQSKLDTTLLVKELGRRLGGDFAEYIVNEKRDDIHNALVTAYSDDPRYQN